MKAYYCFNNDSDEFESVVVFEETAGKAKVEAMRSGYIDDSFGINYTSMRAKRMPELDNSFRGHYVMDWDLDMRDRIDLYEIAGFRCDKEYMMDYFCDECPLKDKCEEYKEIFCDEDQ